MSSHQAKGHVGVSSNKIITTMVIWALDDHTLCSQFVEAILQPSLWGMCGSGYACACLNTSELSDGKHHVQELLSY